MIIKKSHTQHGVSMVELLLVLVLGVFVILMGFQLYFRFKSDQELMEIKYNVDAYFQALVHYYQANCRGGLLDPGFNSDLNPLPSSYSFPVVNGSEDLLTQGTPVYLTQKLLLTGLVDTTEGASGYVAQFNLTPIERSIQIQPLPSNPTKVGTVILWKAQVAVKLKDPSKATMYKGIVGADCISSYNSDDDTVTPCPNTATSTPTPTGDQSYLVWERLPSYASPKTTTALWSSLFVEKNFNMDYTNDITYAINTSGMTPDGEPQFFLCGG